MNVKRLKYLFLLMVGILTNGYIFAQGPLSPLPLENNPDSSQMLLDRWKSSRDFRYMHYLDSLLKNQKKLVSDTVRVDGKTGKVIRRPQEERSFSFVSRILNSTGIGLFLRLLAIFFIGFIFYKVFIESGIFSWSRKRRNTQPVNDPEDPFKEMDEYDRLIREAEKNDNLNEATRFGYLKLLRRLADRGLVHYSIEKTNHDYLKELEGYPFQEPFREITRNYEYVWYGKFLLPRDIYDKIKLSFIRFEEKINVS